MSTTALLPGHAFGAVTVTAATGGTNIPADKAANAFSPAWTTLGSIIIEERNKFDFSAGSGVTLVLKAPAGFEFNTSALPNITFTSGQDITSASISFSNSSNMTVTLNVGGTSGTDQLTIGNTNGLQVRPTAGTPLASGQLFRPQSGGGSASINGVTTSSNADGSGGSNFGTLSEVVGSATKLAFTTQPGTARTGAIFGSQPVVKAQDQFGNNSATGLGPSVNVSMALTSGTGPLLGTTTFNIGTAGGNGTATYTNLEIDVGGTNKQLTASAPGLTSALSSMFTVNSPPTISSIPGVATNEDMAVTIPFTISDLETAADVLVLSGTSSNIGLVPNSNIVFGGSGNDRTVSLYPVTNTFGSSTITLLVSDGTLSSSNSFLLTFNAVNDPPAMNSLTNWTLLEEAATQTVNLSGISPGPGNESTQTLTITTTSSNPSLVPNPTINYTNPNSTGILTFAPAANQFGTAIISVIVKDNGGTANGGIDSLTNSFSVTVVPVNDPPTLNPLSNIVVNPNPGPQNVALSGITPGPSNESTQSLTITAISSNPGVIPDPIVNYTNPSSTGVLVFTPATNASGSATITVTVKDNGGTANGGQDTITRQFLITVTELSDLAISQTAIPSPGFLGGTITFKVAVTNLGPTIASGIQITNRLPAGIGSVSVTSSQGTSTNSGGLVVASLGNLTNGGVATMNVTVQPLTLGSYTNLASVSSSAPDPAPSNNSSSATDAVVPSQFIINGTALLSESCANGRIDPGERVTVSFALQNLSSLNTTSLVATLKATGGVTAPSAPQTYGVLVTNGPAVSRSFDFTPVGDCGGVFVTTLQLQDGPTSLGIVTNTLIFGQLAIRTSSFTNAALISIPSSGQATPYPSTLNVSGLNTNLANVTVTLNRLSHTQTRDLNILLVGPSARKTWLMSDCGGVNTINNVTLTFDNAAASGLPNLAQIVSGTFKPTDFPPDETLPALAPSGPDVADLTVFNGTNPNGLWQLFVFDSTAPFSGNLAGGWTLNVTTLQPSCCVDGNSIDAALVGMPASPNPVMIGSNVTFTIIATNLGPATASGLTITNPVPATATFVSATSSQGSCTNIGAAVVCSLGILTNGGTASMNVTFRTTQPGTLVSSATIAGNEPENALLNNAVSSSVVVIVPAITINDATVAEGNAGTSTNAVFTLQLSAASIQTVSVNYTTTNITSAAGSDFVPTNGLVVFNPGDTTKTIVVTVLGDNINEATKFFGIVLTNPLNATLGNNQATGTIIDDDPLPSLSISDASVVEGNSGTTNLLFTVTLTPVSGQEVSFAYQTANGSAVAGSDYVATNGILALTPGTGTIAIAVPVIGDTLNESNETFFVNLSGVVNATLARNQAVGTITNDDLLANIGASGVTLVFETCAPTNGVIDPNETVTVSFALRNNSTGTASTTNLVATLMQMGGITAPGPAQSYGSLTKGGPPVSRSFTFTANGSCGDTLMAVLQLQDGASNLGTVTNFLTTGKTATVTNSFANSASLTIPGSGPASSYPSTINVSGLAGNIIGMTAKLTSLSHTYPSDVQVLLVGPGGQTVLLMSDAGSGLPISNVTLTFDDAAGSNLPALAQIASGTYKPTDYPPDDPFPSPAPGGPYGTNLAVFNGLNPNGTWSLYVNDASPGDSGSISGGWSLAFNTFGAPVCCGRDSAANLAVGMSSSSLLVVGSNLTYTISVTNLGPDTASDVVLIDSLPVGVSFLSATSSIGSWSNNGSGLIVFNLGTITNSSRATITITGTATSLGRTTNTLTTSARTGDPDLVNNTASAVVTILPPYQLSINPTNLSFGLLAVGQTSTQSFQVINGGGLTLTGSVAVLAPFFVQGDGAFSVPGVQTGQVLVSFIPTAEGSFSNDLVFTSNGGNSTNRASGSGAFVPVAGLSGSPTSGFWPLTVNFSNSSTGTIANIFWDFGDGTTTNTSAASLAHIYAGPSTNTVSLTASGPVGTNTMTRAAYIVVTNLPPKLVLSPTNVDFGPVIVGQSRTQQFQVFNPGQLVLTGSVAVASPFGIAGASSFSVGGGQSNLVLVRFNPTAEGSFSNDVVFTSNGGNSTNRASGSGAFVPVAGLSGSPTSGFWPLTVNFSNSSTGTITNIFWDFGDGTTTNTSAASLAHIYPGPSTNTVSLTASGPVGTNTMTRAAYIVVTNLPPKLVLSPTNVDFGPVIVGQSRTQQFQVFNPGQLVLTGSVAVASPFGIAGASSFSVGGGQSNLVLVRFNPTAEGSFSNDVVFTSNGGNSTNRASGSGAFVPVAGLSGSPTSGFWPLTVNFSNSSTGTITNIFWDFGDGTTTNTSAASLAHIYAGPSTNTVSLTASGPVGTNTMTRAAYIVVTNLPPKLVLSPTNVDFGPVIVGQSRTQQFQVFNPGQLVLTGSVAVASPFGIAGASSFSVGGGQSNLVLVRFNPTAEGSFSNDVVFTSNGGNSTNRASGSGAFVPVAGLSGSPTSGFWPLTVNFSNSSTGTITNIFWDFGDGTTTNTGAASLAHIYPGPSTNTVSLTASGPVGTNTMTRAAYIVVTNLPPKLVLSPTNVDFGPVIVGQSRTQQFQVFNPGQLVLTGSVAVASPFGIAGASSFSVGGGQSSQVLITFIPTVAGSFSNALAFLSNGGNSTNALTGFGLNPAQLNVQPASFDFGILLAGTTAQASFAVTNIGDVTASNVVVTIDGGPFSILAVNSFDLPRNGSTNILVRFAPSTEGVFSNNLIMAIPDGHSYKNRVVGTGATMPQASFTGNPVSGFWPLTVSFTDNSTGTITNRFWTFGDGTTTNTSATQLTCRYSGPGTNTISLIAAGPVGTNTMIRTAYVVVTNLPPKLVLSPTNVDFGPVIVGQSRTQQFQVFNPGQLVLTGSVAVAPPFGIVSGSSFFVDPGQTGQVQVSFSPVQARSISGDAFFTSNGGNSTNALTGFGLAPAQIGVSPATLDFGVVLVGTNRQVSFAVTNLGDITASNVIVTVGGGPFVILAGNSFNLPAHVSTNVPVQFAPGTEAVFSNYLSFVTANAGNSTNAVTGIGTIPLVASFVGSPTAGSAPLTVNFTDNSTGTITNRSWSFGDGSGTNTTASTVAHSYKVGGTYSVSLTVRGPRDTNTLVRANYVSATDVAPSANFTATPTSGSAPLGVQFTDISTGTVTNRFWDFGDGSTTNTVEAQVRHFYSAGAYRVKLTVTGPLGSNSRQRNNYISVTNAPAKLLVTPPNQNFGSVFVGQTNLLPFQVINLGSFSLTGSVATTLPFRITTGSPFVLAGGQTGLVLVAFSPTSAVNYSSNVIFTSSAENSTNPVTGTGVVPPPLVANFSANPTQGLKPLPVSFIDQSTGNITNRFWDFGDGSTTNTVTSSLIHSYVNAGSYAVTLTISGPLGVSTLRRDEYIVVNAPLLVTGLQVSGPNVVISFGSSPNQFYRLEYTDTLTPAVWNPAVSSIPGNGGTVTVTHFGGATPALRFYRIRQLP